MDENQIAETTICGDFVFCSKFIIQRITVWEAGRTLHVHGSFSIHNHKNSAAAIIAVLTNNGEKNEYTVYPGNTCSYSCLMLERVDLMHVGPITSVSEGTFSLDLYYGIPCGEVEGE